jgi:hypothetical protein
VRGVKGVSWMMCEGFIYTVFLFLLIELSIVIQSSATVFKVRGYFTV